MKAREEDIRRGKRRKKKIEKENEMGNTKYINSLIICHCMQKT